MLFELLVLPLFVSVSGDAKLFVGAVGDGSLAIMNSTKTYIYAMGGGFNLADQYDPTTNKWATVASMSYDSYGLAAVTFGSYIYAMGGSNDGVILSVVERYDPTINAWATVASMPTPRWGLSAVTLGNYIYAMGGVNRSGSALSVVERYDPASVVERYDPATNSWTTVASMPTARYWFAAATLGNYIYAMGGVNDSGDILNVVERYDPTINAWATVDSMPTARAHCAAAAV